jgi:hypothetical protein
MIDEFRQVSAEVAGPTGQGDRMSSRRGLSGWLLGVVVTFSVGMNATAHSRQDQSKPQEKKPDTPQSQAEAQEIQGLVRVADAAMTGQQAPADFPIEFQNDFLKAQGSRVWVPMTLTIDSSKLSNPAGEPVAFYLRVAPRGMTTPPAAPAPAATDKENDKKKDKGKDKDKDKDKDAKPGAAPPAPAYPFEDLSFPELKPAAAGQPVRILRGFGVPAGTYDVYLVVRERNAPAGATPKTSVLKQPVDVPDYSSEFSTSSVILAERVEQLPSAVTPDTQAERPYAFGQTELVTSPEKKFSKSQELIVLLQIYNPTITPEKKFNVEATYTFYTIGADGEKRFNSTQPQPFTNDTMGPGFDPSAADRSIQAGQGIPLQRFPEGKYRLEVKITDKLSSKVLTQNVNFSVAP